MGAYVDFDLLANLLKIKIFEKLTEKATMHTYVNDLDEWPARVDSLIVPFMVFDSVIVILDSFLWIPAFILTQSLSNVATHGVKLTSGEDILTLLILASIISLLSHKVSESFASGTRSLLSRIYQA